MRRGVTEQHPKVLAVNPRFTQSGLLLCGQCGQALSRQRDGFVCLQPNCQRTKFDQYGNPIIPGKPHGGV